VREGDSEVASLVRGSVGFSRSSDHTYETGRTNQMHQILATRREMISGTHSSLSFSTFQFEEPYYSVALLRKDQGIGIGG
jgi:hypothetical protein